MISGGAALFLWVQQICSKMERINVCAAQQSIAVRSNVYERCSQQLPCFKFLKCERMGCACLNARKLMSHSSVCPTSNIGCQLLQYSTVEPPGLYLPFVCVTPYSKVLMVCTAILMLAVQCFPNLKGFVDNQGCGLGAACLTTWIVPDSFWSHPRPVNIPSARRTAVSIVSSGCRQHTGRLWRASRRPRCRVVLPPLHRHQHRHPPPDPDRRHHHPKPQQLPGSHR